MTVAAHDRPYWWDTIAASGPFATQPPASADVAIVGAGYTGLAAARLLASRGARVVVLEREQVGWGASSRNGGQVLTGLKLDAATLVQKYGEARARELFAIGQQAIAHLEDLIAAEGIDCEYERVGHVQAASKPGHFQAFADEQKLLARTFGYHVSLVSRQEQHREIGSDAYFGLLVDDRSGGLNPAAYVAGLAQAAVRAGAAIAEHTAVVGIRRAGARWAVSTTRGGVDARDVLIATNGYSGHAAPAMARRLIPIGSYIVTTEPLDADVAAHLVPRRRMVFDSRYFLNYFRVTADRRLLFGGRARFARPTPRATRDAAEILRRDLARVFPQLSRVRIDYAWSGNVAFTVDQMPRAGRLEEAYYAGGYCGHGIAMATWLGTEIARRIAGEPIDNPLFDDRFAPIPLYHGTPWFLPLVGAYYRFKDLVG